MQELRYKSLTVMLTKYGVLKNEHFTTRVVWQDESTPLYFVVNLDRDKSFRTTSEEYTQIKDSLDIIAEVVEEKLYTRTDMINLIKFYEESTTEMINNETLDLDDFFDKFVEQILESGSEVVNTLIPN